MRHLLEIAKTGLTAIRLHPLRASATVGAVVVVLVPYLAGLGLSYGIQAEAEDSIRFGADLYVTGQQLGRDVPVPLSTVEAIRQIDGVTDVTPRIVGALVLGTAHENVVLVGMPADRFPAAVE